MSTDQLDYGVLVEGTINQTKEGKFLVVFTNEAGQLLGLDVDAVFSKYFDKKVRFILTPCETIDKLADQLEQQNTNATSSG